MKDTVEKLIIALGDKDCNVRWKAVEMLGEMGTTAVEPLIRVLRDGRWGGRFPDHTKAICPHYKWPARLSLSNHEDVVYSFINI